jgi:SAM-dependent methyltransferase
MLGGLAIAGGFTSTPSEWAARNDVLGASMSELVNVFVRSCEGGRGLDVGCQAGALCDRLALGTRLRWCGIDPAIEPGVSQSGAELLPHWAHQTPFKDGSFACVVFANVFEHVEPHLRTATLAELHRILTDDGVLVGQLPNPFFPIESHSRLPFMGYLPISLQQVYWNLSPVNWERQFYSVSINDLQARAGGLGFVPLLVRNFNYPAEVVPRNLRWAASLFEHPPLNNLPWAWQFVFRKQSHES